MTKAEERRLFLQQQSQATPTQPVVQPTASAPTKAEQRRVQLTQQQIASPLRSALSMASGIQTIANNVPTQPTPQPVVTQPVQPTQPIQKSQTTAPGGSMQEKLQNGGTLNLQEQEQLARELGINNETIDYTRGRINAANQINPATKYAYALFRSGIKENPNSDHLKNMFEENDPIRAYDRSIEAGKLRAVKPQAEAEAKAIFDEIKAPGTFGNEGYVGGQEYQEYKGKLEEAKANKDYYNIAKYQYLYDKAKEDLKKNMKSWYGASYEKDILKIIDSIDMHQKAYNDAKGGKYEEFYREKLARDLRDLADYETYSELFRNKVIDEAEILLHTGSANLANTLEGIMRDTSGPLYGMPGDLRQIKGSDLIETNKKAQQPSDKIEFTMGRSSFDHLKAYIEKHPEASQELKDVYAQISNGTYKGTAKDIDRIVGEEFDKRNTLTARENLERKLQIQNEMFDEKYKPSDFEKKVEDALEVVVAQIPQRGLMLVNPGLGYTAMYENAGNQNYNRVRADGANLNQAQANKILSGGLEVGTELLTESSIDTAFGGAGLLKPSDYTKFITNGAIRTGLNTAFDFAGEGFEEMVSTEMQPWIDRITYNPNARLATEDELWGSFVDSLLPTAILGGTSRAMVAVENYANSATRKIQNSTLTDVQKAELINEIENGRKELIKQIEAHKAEIDTAVEETQNNTPAETPQQETPQVTQQANTPNQVQQVAQQPTNEELTQNETNKIANEPIVNVENETKEKPTKQTEKPSEPPIEKKRSWPQTAKQNELVNEFLDVKDMTYVPTSNEKQLAYAQQQTDNMGYAEAIEYLENKIKLNERITADDVALGEYLINEATKRGDYERAVDLISDVAILGTDYGQAVQALSLISRLTPEGQLKYLNKVVDKLNTKINQQNKNKSDSKKKPNIKLDGELAKNILKADNPVDLQKAMDDALQNVADQMDVTIGDKIAEWRYLSMLGNPLTHIRNVVANIAMRGTYAVKNAIQRTLEAIVKPAERTRTFKKATTDVKKFAAQSAEENLEMLTGGTNKTVEGRIKEMRTVFKNGALEKLRKLNSNMLSLEDNVFTKNAFKTNLAEYLTANGIKTQADIEANPKTVQKGIQFAAEEAWKTTFHQMSKAATQINKLENINGVSKLIIGGTIPFKKTPINIAKTGASYSPLGLLETVSAETYKLKNGDINVNQYIDRLSQGLTGVGLFGVGALLASMGILRGSNDKEKDDEYKENIGQTKGYSIRLGNRNYDISWLSPAAMPLLMGAELINATNGEKTEIGDIAEALGSTLNPLTEMSFLSGVNSTLKSYSNSKSPYAAISAIGENALKSYFGQFVPTVFGQINKVVDPTQRTTTPDKDSKFKSLESFGRQQLNKIPGGSYLLEPKTDVWGNDVKRADNPVVRALDAFVNPGKVTEDRTTRVDEEILSLLSEVGDKDIIPKIPSNYYESKNYKYEMTAKDYTTFKKNYGQEAYKGIEKLLDSEDYTNATAEEKVKKIKEVYDNAKKNAREKYEENKYAKDGEDYKEKVYEELDNNENFNSLYHVGEEGKKAIKEQVKKDALLEGKSDNEVTASDVIAFTQTMDKLEEAGIPLADYYLTWYAQKDRKNKKAKKTAISNMVDDIGGTKDQKNVLYEIFNIN